jgi:hypothetical protein
MSILFEFKRKVLREGLAVCIVHHISEKIGLNYNEIMTTLDTGKLVMGNSTIYQCADNIIIITSPDRGKFMKTQYIRPIAKRFLIDTDPFVIELHEDKENMWYEYVGKYEEKDKCIEAILIFLKSDGNWRDFMEIYQGLDREYGQVKLREKLAYLSDKNIIIRKLEKPNIFKYRFPPRKRSVKYN